MTIMGKELADKTVKELTLIEKIDENEMKLGLADIPKNKNEVTLHELFTYFKKEYMVYKEYAVTSIVRYKRIMERLEDSIDGFGPDFPFSKLSYKLILEKYGTGNKNQCLSMIRCINHIGAIGIKGIHGENDYSNATLEGNISSRPIKFPKPKGSNKNALTKAQLDEIYSNPEIDEVTKDIMRLYIITGCRRTELVRPYFTWDQIDAAAGVAYIRNKGNKKKHDKLFEIPWLKPHQELIARIHAHYKNNHDLADIYPIPCTAQNLYERLVTARKKSGIFFTVHDLRDTGATMILRSTNNIYAAKEFCGHKSVKDTEESYADYIIDDKKRATTSLINSMGALL